MFKRLFGARAAAGGQEKAPKLTAALSTSIYAVVGKRSIPTMPAAAQRAFRLAVDPNAGARDFVEVIESDEALSARVIKIANSVYFERGKKSETIEECVQVIGVNELRNLLSATSLSEIFPTKHAARAQLWANDVATGLTAKILAARLPCPKPDLAFLGGFMHDIGKLLLLQRAEELYEQVLRRVGRSGCTFTEAEQELFVFNHCEVGQLIAEQWNFSTDLIDVIRNHHAPLPERAEPATLRLCHVVGAADTISHALGLGHSGGFAGLQNRARDDLERLWGFLGVAEPERRGFLRGVQRAFDVEKELYQKPLPA